MTRLNELVAMMADKCAGEEAKRPSVETLLHDLLAQCSVLFLRNHGVFACGSSAKEVESYRAKVSSKA